MKNLNEKVGRVLSKEEQKEILGGSPGCRLASAAAYANCMATKPPSWPESDCIITAQFVYENCIIQ